MEKTRQTQKLAHTTCSDEQLDAWWCLKTISASAYSAVMVAVISERANIITTQSPTSPIVN
jgi:hypothetical protein